MNTRPSLKKFAGIVLLLVFGAAAPACTFQPSGGHLFENIPSSHSNVHLVNDLEFTGQFNIYTYKDFYAGGGVAIGDVNNDGLPDVYVVANQKPNALYVNRGDFTFEDVTEAAGVAGSRPWSTGVSMVDVNADGFMDIYVTNAGSPDPRSRENELFINNGDLTFTERAQEFGLADQGYSIHAAFFDYDRDGFLDAFVLNNYASKPIGRYDPTAIRRDAPSSEGGDRLYRNVDGHFEDVTVQAGIFSSEAGFGLGVSVGDLNRDGWPDMYVSNDFFERDYLYVNNTDGTFSEVLPETLNSISTTSMGGDISDLNNDGYPEIFVSDMLPATEQRLKTVSDFVDWDRFQAEVSAGYHKKFARNTLQYNNGDGTFSEIGRYAGVAATDWSWGGLAADFNLDGLRDLFVTNGFYKDVTNKDHMVEMIRSGAIRAQSEIDFVKLVDMTPSAPLPNVVFENLGHMRFANRSAEWGLDDEGFSSGSAYGDLDADGDLDLVVNNVHAKPSLYRNRAAEQFPYNGWIQLVLAGERPNTWGVGAQVEIVTGSIRRYAEQMPQRGFQSSMDPTLHVGLGPGVATIDSLVVRWPDGRVSMETKVPAGQRLTVRQQEARRADGDGALLAGGDQLALPGRSAHGSGDVRPSSSRPPSTPASTVSMLREAAGEIGLEWSHEESIHNDFERTPLAFHMRSTESPALCAGDVSGDGLEDVYVGGARHQPGALFAQRPDGRLAETTQPALEADRESEDTDCEFVDVDGDDVPELIVAGGSSEFAPGDESLSDRLYRMNAGGALERIADALPVPESGHEPTGVIRAADADGDGDADLFVGTRLGATFGIPVGGRLLENDGSGTFTDATDELAPDLRPQRLQSAGVTDAAWGDLDGDGSQDLIVVGEWMPLTVFFNRNGRLERADPQSVGLAASSGWWRSVEVADLDADGSLDLVAGNVGTNSLFSASPKRPLQLWTADFNRNGRLQHIFAYYNEEGGPYPAAPRQELIQQLPYLKTRIRTFADYAGMTVHDIFGSEELDEAVHYAAEQMATVVGWNDGQGVFAVDSLPFRAQWTAIYGILAKDLDGDRIPEILLGGNLHAVRPQVGSYDAGHGTVLRLAEDGEYHEVDPRKSGFAAPGEIRAIESLKGNGRTIVLVARNNDRLLAFGAGPDGPRNPAP